MKRYFNLIYVLILIIAGCAAPQELLQKNLATLYDPSANFTEIDYLVIHQNDSLTNVVLNLPMKDFEFTHITGENTYSASISLSYGLYESYESEKMLDSGTIKIKDTLNYQRNIIVPETLKIKAKQPGEFILKLVITDRNRKKENMLFIPVYKESSHSSQNFSLIDENGGTLVSNYLRRNEKFSLRQRAIEKGKLSVRYYHRDFPVALPPFSMEHIDSFDYKSDSTFSVDVNSFQTGLIDLAKPGFYQFQCDANGKDGLTVFVYSDDFPAVTLPSDILFPLRYISTQREFDHLASQSNQKLASDSFWLENSGNEDRARTLISKYYNRVQVSNKLFTSYLEGWKTDRGMIYIVFGPPNHVFRATNTEMWIYGEAGNPQSLRFSFIRVNNPFTYNDYSLYRNPLFKEYWYRAVENWRR